MSPLAIKTFRSIPTKYELNGPKLSFSSGTSLQPSSVTINNKENASFTGIVTVTYPSTFVSSSFAGTIEYQWYDQDGIVTDESRFNDATLGTTIISGSNTNTLTVTNAVNPTDTNRQYYLVANYISDGSTANALNNPLQSNVAVLTVRPYLSVVTQPINAIDTIENSVTFNTSAIASDGTNSQITYQWRINGTNLLNGTFGDKVVSGANSQSLTIKVTTGGTYTIDCLISHPSAHPGSITSNAATYESRDKAQEIVVEYFGFGSPGDWESTPTGTRYNITDSPITFTRGDRRWTGVFAPDRDVDALVTMGGAAAEGSNGGQGGWMTFRYTFKKGVEHTFILQPRDGGGRSIRDSSGRKEGNNGGGGAFFYRLNKLVAVCGGGGGGSRGGAGGDGSGGNISSGSRKGTNGFGNNGGLGGDGGPDDNSPGGITNADESYYWFAGTFNSSSTFADAANKVDINNPDKSVTNIIGPLSSFGGQFKVVDYRSNQTYNGSIAATRGVRVREHPKGSVNHINMLGDTKNDCYRIITDSLGNIQYIQDIDKDTTNNVNFVNVADWKAGRRSIGYDDINGNWTGDINNKIPNTNRNLIGNGLGQTPGAVINYHNRAVRVENVGGGDDINSTFNGKPRKTKAFSSIFERDNPRNNYGVVARNSAEIIRGFRFGDGSRVNGGWSKFGGAGGGNGAAGGGSGSGYPSWSGGGGGSGWAGNGATVYQSVTGGNIGNAFVTIRAFDDSKTVAEQLPPEPTSPNPRWDILNWDDTRNFGWKTDSDGERWPTDSSGGISFSNPSSSNGNGTYFQIPPVRDGSGNWIKKGGLNERKDNFHRLYVGNSQNPPTGGTPITDSQPGFSGNLYFTRNVYTGANADSNGEKLWTPLRINSLTNSLDEVAYLEFELKLPDFGASRFETSKGSEIYTIDIRPDERAPEDVFIGDSSTKQKNYYYTHNKPPSKYLRNSNSVRKKWNPFTDRKTSSGSIPYPSSQWTYSFNEAYIPFEIKLKLVLEFRDIRYHEDDSSIGSAALDQWKKIEYISDWIDFGSPWTMKTLQIRSRDLWNTIHYSGLGSGDRFYPYNSSIWNYKDPFISKFEIYEIRDKDTGSINTLNLYPVLGPYSDYVKLEVGRGILL